MKEKEVSFMVKKMITAISTFIILNMTAFAIDDEGKSAIASSKIGTGVTNLIQDLTVWGGSIGTLICIVALIFCLIRKSMADEMEQAQWKKRISGILVCAVGIIIAAPLVYLINSYFK